MCVGVTLVRAVDSGAMAVLLLMLVMAAVLPFLGVNGQSCNLDEYNLNAEALRLPK